ncbi:pilus assembly protein [Microbulbifer taiwanensis]|uniref:Pilus assembly protein n=1 Tax=Microbulbifer taiwanensis TaxID=986746 RepID=A0ABW1YT61_9GAMM|nr:PilC/PilY family type IV pilus protein [Microbulbifer taiwanensis]
MDDGNRDTNDPWRTWDTNGDCFEDGADYRAWFYAHETDGSYYETGSHAQFGDYRDESASGKLLNWYFSEQNGAGSYVAAKFVDSDGEATRSKVPVTRTDVMKTSAAELVSGLEDVRVGIMEFNDDDDGNRHNGVDGARALVGLTSVTDDTRASLLDVIDGIGASGSTPLSESFTGVGRYFITGYEDNNLSYKGSDGSTETAAGKDIFDEAPDWNDANPDVPLPGGDGSGVEDRAIQYYCQKSFMVALTDGEPTSDDEISDHLRDYDYSCSSNTGGCTSSEMDDVVKALYDIDLRPDLKKPDGEPVTHNIISYIIGFAEDGLSDTNVMKNAGALGGGGVYDAANASQLKVTFNQIINKVHEITGSSSSVAFNSTSLEADSALFAAKFNSGDWDGELSALSIDENGDISTTASWEASDKLKSATPSSRVMLTTRDGKGVPFTDAALEIADDATDEDLNYNTSTGVSVIDNRSSDRIDYLRGDQSNEGTDTDKFRKRASRLGDIVNSTPVFVGAPNAAWSKADFSEASSYSTFKSGKSGRTPMVYVGANDGFLHGFNANTAGTGAGKELIAYSPEVLLSTERDYGLHALTSQYYSHKYYVDGTPTASDAYVGGNWKTVLVGGLGGGGKGFYALDITDPSLFTEDNAESLVMWEFTDADDDSLGYTFSRPQIGRMQNDKWAAIFGNGYNSTDGDAGLFIVFLDGSGYKYISTGTADADDKNGMSTPAIVDSDLNGIVDRIYAGDLKGNMWVFDVTSNVASGWSVINDDAGKPQPLFTAVGEPITGAPLVARNTDNPDGSDPNLLVTFGTGQYITAADTATTGAGGFYVVADNGTYGLKKGNLVSRSIGTRNVTQPDGSVRSYRTLGGDELKWADHAGWYIQLKSGISPDGGERVVTRPDLLRNVLFFNTLIPTGQVCSAGGYGWLMSVDVRTGLAPVKHAVFDGNGDGKINSGDQGLVGQMVSEGIPNKPGFLKGNNGIRQYTPNSAGTIPYRPVEVGDGDRVGRLSWEEITPN